MDNSNDWNDADILKKPAVAVTLPHDWSIEQPFDKFSPSGNRGAALPGGLGIYEKLFVLNDGDKSKNIFIVFDGWYMNSTVTINGHTLGTRPFGYISFEYDLTAFLKFNGDENLLKVRVENKQPNSRWYSGSGIYRNMWLDKRGEAFIKNWGTYIATPEVKSNNAVVNIEASVVSSKKLKDVNVKTSVYDPDGKLLQTLNNNISPQTGIEKKINNISIADPQFWSPQSPKLYKAVFEVTDANKNQHTYSTNFGIRDFYFDKEKGFFLNGKHLKIIGACMHHDLGVLGAAINISAMRRQLQIMKSMGINGIRTSHNPPAPEWLDLCDEKGFPCYE